VRTMPHIAIVMPTHNALPQLAATMTELRWVEGREDVVLVLADSASTDGTLEYAETEAPWVAVVHGDESMWWAAATNLGCHYALRVLGCDTVCLLNHDCLLPSTSFDRLLAEHRRHPSDIICSRVLIKGEQRVLYGGGSMAWTGMLTMRGFHAPASSSFPSGRVVWCGGMGVVFGAKLWESLRGFDDRAFPHYHADADFCLRVRRLGASVRYCDEAVVVNDRASTGLGVVQGEATVGRLLATLGSRRSPYRVPDALRFYRRHLGARWPLALAHLYGIHLGSALKRIAMATACRWASGPRGARPSV